MNLKPILLILFVLSSIPLGLSLDVARVEVGADKLNSVGITGEGSVICLIDTGVDYTHENLGACSDSAYTSGTCKSVLAGINTMDNTSNITPNSDEFHGTHIAGIIISNHSIYRGVSPDSKLIVAKHTSNRDGSFSCQSILDAIDWCVSKSEQYNVTAISFSLGPNSCRNSYSLQFQSAINNAHSHGILFVKSAGNDPPDIYMTFPAELGNVTVVGSTTKNQISTFSARAPPQNLDILAPGDKIRSTMTGGGLTPFLNQIVCSDDPDSFLYKILPCNSGTSFSTPIVAASTALFRQYDSAITPSEIERTLKETGDPIYSYVGNANFTKINLPNAFHLYDWPTFHHDNRRTGFTLLKGDMTSQSRVESINLVLDGDSNNETVSRPSIADVDRDGHMDVVVTTASLGGGGAIYSLEHYPEWYESKPTTKQKWSIKINQSIVMVPTLANLDSDNNLEVLFGLDNGTLYAIDVTGDKTAQIKWAYSLSPKEGSTGKIGNIAVDDIDNDGTNEIIFMDGIEGDGDWSGEVYVLRDNGNNATLEAKYNISNGGGEGAVSLANIDDDDYTEIIVPGYFGVRVLDYDGSTLTKKWNNSDGRIDGSIVVYDIDRDGRYELIYTTSTAACTSPHTCSNKLYIRDAETGSNEGISPKSINTIARATPSIANMDSDSNLEIVFSARDSSSQTNHSTHILCYDPIADTESCNYNDGGNLSAYIIAPNLFDVDGDGRNEIIMPSENYKLYIINGTGGQLYPPITLAGIIGSAPAIGDIDGDKRAEIAVRRGGSPINVLTFLSDFNQQPELTITRNVTAIAGELIDISNISFAEDIDNANLTIDYSSPFNESGMWQTTINDTGNYSVVIGVSDGNLTDIKTFELMVFDSTIFKISNFTDGTSKKTFTYNSSINQSTQIRLPKNASIVYAKAVLSGGAS